MATFGYARVSTRDQDLAGQIAELQAAGCGNIFKEKASGARTDRPELAKLIRRLDAGDVLIVTRLDRLARSTRDLLNILDAVGKAGAARDQDLAGQIAELQAAGCGNIFKEKASGAAGWQRLALSRQARPSPAREARMTEPGNTQRQRP